MMDLTILTFWELIKLNYMIQFELISRPVTYIIIVVLLAIASGTVFYINKSNKNEK